MSWKEDKPAMPICKLCNGERYINQFEPVRWRNDVPIELHSFIKRCPDCFGDYLDSLVSKQNPQEGSNT